MLSLDPLSYRNFEQLRILFGAVSILDLALRCFKRVDYGKVGVLTGDELFCSVKVNLSFLLNLIMLLLVYLLLLLLGSLGRE